jgi:hypothetical protein
MDHEPVDGARTRSLVPLLLIVGIGFLAGLAAMAWLLSNSSGAARLIGIAPAAPAQQAVPRVVTARAPIPVATPVDTPETQRLVIDPETTRRVAQLEQRVEQIDQQSRSAVGNADRAEGLLVAFAARRALDRGVPLGYIEGLLRQRFGNSQRVAVGTIITAARQPVTLEELQQGLGEVGQLLTGGGPNQTWWTALRAELGGLIAVRKSGAPSTLPAERLRRAQERVDAGQVDVALAEVLRMPGRDSAAEWVAAARRYVAARRALDTIETAALLEPRNPAPVTEPAPAISRNPG